LLKRIYGYAKPISTKKIIECLRYENPWWIIKEIPDTYSTMSKRLYFDLFYPFVLERSIKKALVLLGQRRRVVKQ